MNSVYVPYSIRNNITDPQLWLLYDYLERDLGWDIKMIPDGIKCVICNADNSTKITYSNGGYHYDEISISGYIYAYFPRDLFFAIYKSILPAIRDLYEKEIPSISNDPVSIDDIPF